MANNVLGYIGIENYDLILYLARILTHLGKRVLLIDYTNSGALTACIPIPSGMNAYDDVIDFCRISFCRQDLNIDLISDYDDIIIDFGINNIDQAMKYCTRVVYSTDLQKHNIEMLKSIPEIKVPNIQLLIKDVVDCKINQSYILDKVQKEINKVEIEILYQDLVDLKYKVLVQFDILFVFKGITSTKKSYLKDMVKKLYPITDKELKEAYKRAERGI